MNELIKQTVLDTIKAYNRIIITRHSRPDGDAVGSTLGLSKILKASYPEKEIYLANDDYSAYVAFLGDEGPKPTANMYADALVIVIDTGTADRISNALAFTGKEVLKIDHHIVEKPYGDIVWVEETRSSSCEMIVDFYLTFRDELVMNKEAAQCLYCGMVTDSGRFRFNSVTPQTLRCAAVLLEHGLETDSMYAHLYLEDYSVLVHRAELIQHIQMTEHGVAWMYMPASLRTSLGFSQEDASNIISLMESIKGSLIWLAFIENDDGSIRVRLRSRFVTVQELATRYHGGGHACASGATVYSQDEMQILLAEADSLLDEYKQKNQGWI